MEQQSNSDHDLERLAVKSLFAADILKNAVTIAENLQKMQKKASRYIQQVKLILTWKQGCGILKMVGSATKTVGGVLVVAAPLHPKLGLAVNIGHKLWKFGTGLKVLTALGHTLKNMWQLGCRNSLVDFVHATALLTHKLDVFGEVIRDLQTCVQSANTNIIKTPEALMNGLSQFILPHQIDYITHVINIALGNQGYSPLFDFIMSSELTSSSSMVQLMREIESFNFTDFVVKGNCKSFIAIGSFLHISHELLDFLDGFHNITEQDCRFLSECLTKFTQESMRVMKVVAVLTHLHQGFAVAGNLRFLENRDECSSKENLTNLQLVETNTT